MKTCISESWLLLVDDCPNLRELIADVLRDAGLNVLAVESGSQALAALNFFEVDAVLTDLHLPDMKGTTVFAAATQGRRLPPEAVMLISGDVTGLSQPGVRGLAKPFDLDSLVTAATECLRAGIAWAGPSERDPGVVSPIKS